MTVGQRIKTARERAGITQFELGEKVGVSGVAIMRYEKDQRQPRLEQLSKIARALGTTLYELVGDEYFSSHTREELVQMWKEVPFLDVSARDRVDTALGKLNDAGMEKAADAVEVIAEVPRYRAETAPQPPAGASRDTAPAPPEGSEKPTGGSETPPEGE